MNSKIRPINVTSNWAKGNGREIHVDTVDWPDNKPCARKVKSESEEGKSKRFRVFRKKNLLSQ